MEPVIVVLIIFGSVGSLVWKFIDTRNKERMAMIDKGMSASDLRGSVPSFRPNALSNLKWGLLALFCGIGVLVANYMSEVLGWEESVYPALILAFGGLSLILFYAIAAAKEKKQSN